jgi:hypothetical protein
VILAQSIPVWKLYQHVPVLVFIFAFGAIVGSFINVVIYRLPAGMSVITPSSRCPTCGARLSWWENTPILGWLLVRGRCRHCGVGISPQYMLVELFMALLFAGLYVAFYMAGPVVVGRGRRQLVVVQRRLPDVSGVHRAAVHAGGPGGHDPHRRPHV